MTPISEKPLAWPARGLATVVDRAVASHARATALLILVALLAFLPGFFQIPPVDRDEARIAQSTKQMVETGDYVDIRFQNDPQYRKPAGIFWLQAGVVQVATALGVRRADSRIAVYRVPSLIGAIGAVLLTYWTALAFVSRRASLLAGLMLATSIGLGVQARLATTDAMLLACSIAAFGALARAYLGDRRPPLPGAARWVTPAVFWTALAGGILVKGPMIVVFVGLAVAALVALDRSARWLMALQPLPGIAWLVLLTAPWVIAIAGRSGEDFFVASVGREWLGRIVSLQDGILAPPGFYLVLFWVTFWPGATLAALAAPAIWAARRERGARFLLAWIVPSWIALELAITKLPHYVLPLYPAIAILIAGIVDQRVLSRRRWLQAGPGWWFVLPAIVGIGGIVCLMVIGRRFGLLAWPLAAGAAIFGLFAWWLYQADGAERSLLRGMSASILLAFAIYAVAIPGMSPLFPAAGLERAMRSAGCQNPAVVSAGYHEPSLVFLIDGEIRAVDGAGAADFLNVGGCRFAFVEARQERGFLRRADAIGLRYALGPRIEGINIARGRRVSIAIYRAER